MDYRPKAYSIIFARSLYALNWFDIAPALKYISADLHMNVIQIGLATTSFYIGLALFQLVGGSLAHRIGNLVVSVTGLGILGTFGIFSGLSTNFVELSVSRFMAGAGSALFFSPALGIISDIVPVERYGSYVSVYNGAFSFGAGTGIFAFGYLDTITGWRLSLVIGGLLLILADLALFILMRRENLKKRRPMSDLIAAVKKPALWILPVVTVGSAISETIMGQLFVYYLEEYRHFSAIIASLAGSFFLFVGLPGGFISAFIIRRYSRKVQVTSLFVLMSLIFFFVPFERNLAEILITLFAFSVLSIYGFSYLYMEASNINRSAVSFSLSVVNFVQMMISSAVPYLYTYAIYSVSVNTGWYLLGVISLVPALFIVKIK
ncbi:MFS transporter [Thermoplasma sp. Kam2015]|uniref:MFS transporter n=1 Tax=Thermoplasma sp. Kam2015 TaxID=2094122 RepID=UPI000D8504C3|nr:MFS transporter [Thermoplasma sp. Kam2015]PYB67995.1 MFS transporter [Thermoplasma sp. Kam2015]